MELAGQTGADFSTSLNESPSEKEGKSRQRA